MKKITTGELSTDLSLSKQHVRTLLRKLEKAGLVERIGQRGGWQPTERAIELDRNIESSKERDNSRQHPS